LGSSRLPTKTKIYRYWISLDFLVLNETYQWVMRGKPSKDFSPPVFKAPMGTFGPGMRTGEFVHRASLTGIQIFCNNLSSRQFIRIANAMPGAHGLISEAAGQAAGGEASGTVGAPSNV
jgi:hypothetical protein